MLGKFMNRDSHRFMYQPKERLRKNISCVDSHLIMGSLRGVRQQPDNFMHVKKFANLDAGHSNEQDASFDASEYDSDFLDEDSKMDMSDLGQRRKWRSSVVDAKADVGIDSIVMSEPLDQILEETPNNII
jgi:hypothetical protein